MKEMAIERVALGSLRGNDLHVVVLKEKEGDRYLPIWILPVQGEVLVVGLGGVQIPMDRPLTIDLLGTVIHEMGGSVNHVVVSELRQDAFFAKVFIRSDGRTLEVDSRPSDALALAVRSKAPVYAEEAVLEKAGTIDPSRFTQLQTLWPSQA